MPVTTTLNQCRRSGKVTASEGVQLATEGGVLSGSGWVHHDGIGYLLQGEGAMHIETMEKSASWESINRSRPGDSITGSVFSCWLDHGEKPKDAEYVYQILPDVSAADMAALSQRRDIEVLSNSSDLQAVWHKGLGIMAAAFYSPGKIECVGMGDLAVDFPCILLVRKMPGNRFRIAFSKPDLEGPAPERVTVLVGERKVMFSPPRGPEKGKPEVKEISF